MEIDPEDQAFLRRFQSLSTHNRRAIFRRFLDQLHPDEWREVKVYAEAFTCPCDLLGTLPLEIASLVAENLPLVDIIRLRRVSRRWKQVLSSPSLCRAAVRATLGHDPWTPVPQRDAVPGISLNADSHASFADTSAPSSSLSDAPVPAITPSPASGPNPYSSTSFTYFVKRRRRLEQGNPWKVRTLRSPLDEDEDKDGFDMRTRVAYSEGSCAWLDPRSDSTAIEVWDLLSDEREFITTANREKLLSLQFSKPLVAAVSIRGYCHVWDINTGQSDSFRLPSTVNHRILITGTKIVVHNHKSVVHWCWHARIARLLKLTGSLDVISVHPEEDRMTTIQLLRKNGKAFVQDEHIEDCQLQIATHGLDSNGQWGVLASQREPFPKGALPLDHVIYGGHFDSYALHQVGQTSASWGNGDVPDLWEKDLWASIPFTLAVDPDGLVAIHMTGIKGELGLLCPEQGILFAVHSRYDGSLARVAITKPWSIRRLSSSCVLYDYHTYRDIRLESRRPWVIGDARFVLFLDPYKIEIWAMDERDQGFQGDINSEEEESGSQEL